MMDDSAPIHERRKLIKTYKNVLPWKRIVAAKVCGETYSKNDKKKEMDKKNGHKCNELTPQINGKRWEREWKLTSPVNSFINLISKRFYTFITKFQLKFTIAFKII